MRIYKSKLFSYRIAVLYIIIISSILKIEPKYQWLRNVFKDWVAYCFDYKAFNMANFKNYKILTIFYDKSLKKGCKHSLSLMNLLR